jgi:hypothetical protein
MEPDTESAAAPDAAAASDAAARAEDAAAWDALVRRWEEEDVHRAYLARFVDLDGLAEAGRRYRAALDARPGDAIAARWREEVVKRATALAFAALPRGADVAALARRGRQARLAAYLVVALLFAAAAWMMFRSAGGTP